MQVNNKSQKDKDKPTFNNHQSKMIMFFICIFLVVYFLINGVFGLKFVKTSGDSMTPGLKNGSIMITEKLMASNQRNYKRGTRIVFDAYGVDPRCQQNSNYVKRIIGVPGDKINYKNGVVYINGKPEDKVITDKFKTDQNQSDTKPLVAGGPDEKTWNLKELSNRKLYGTDYYYWNKYSINKGVVPKGYYFVMGDHRKVSNDSREFGYVPANKIVGKVIFHF